MNSLRIKICGVTRPSDVEAANRYGADAIGLNFYPPSPRYLEPRAAANIVRVASPLMSTVGVFVHQPLRQAYAMAYQLGLRGVQCYPTGDERLDPFPFALILAYRIREASHLEAIRADLVACREAGYLPGAILIDAHVDGQIGGTGVRAPWELLVGFDAGVPLILAGGLTPDNVGDAVRMVQPAGVDVASGVESAPGHKDPIKVRDFIDHARSAAKSRFSAPA